MVISESEIEYCFGARVQKRLSFVNWRNMVVSSSIVVDCDAVALSSAWVWWLPEQEAIEIAAIAAARYADLKSIWFCVIVLSAKLLTISQTGNGY